MSLIRDTLFLLESPFRDDKLPGQIFYCPYCAQLEGALMSIERPATLDVVRVAFPRPRSWVVDLIGDPNQSLPTMVLADDAPAHLATGDWNGQRFTKGNNAILRVLSERHGYPEPHP